MIHAADHEVLLISGHIGPTRTLAPVIPTQEAALVDATIEEDVDRKHMHTIEEDVDTNYKR